MTDSNQDKSRAELSDQVDAIREFCDKLDGIGQTNHVSAATLEAGIMFTRGIMEDYRDAISELEKQALNKTISHARSTFYQKRTNTAEGAVLRLNYLEELIEQNASTDEIRTVIQQVRSWIIRTRHGRNAERSLQKENR